jgi:preprotein translocase subunit Sec63
MNAYQILGIIPGATEDEIKKAYRHRMWERLVAYAPIIPMWSTIVRGI